MTTATTNPTAVLDDAKVRARQNILFRAIVPLRGGSMLSVYDCGQGTFLYGFTFDGQLSYTQDENEAIALLKVFG